MMRSTLTVPLFLLLASVMGAARSVSAASLPRRSFMVEGGGGGLFCIAGENQRNGNICTGRSTGAVRLGFAGGRTGWGIGWQRNELRSWMGAQDIPVTTDAWPLYLSFVLREGSRFRIPLIIDLGLTRWSYPGVVGRALGWNAEGTLQARWYLHDEGVLPFVAPGIRLGAIGHFPFSDRYQQPAACYHVAPMLDLGLEFGR